VLATVCFLKQVALFAGAPAPEPFRHYCDNQSVIRACGKDQVVPDRMAADWDVLSQLHVELAGRRIRLVHVKGHQDRETPVAALPAPARLNCAADKLAGAHCRRMRHPCKRAELFPAARVAIHQVAEGSITYRLAAHLRHFRNSPPLKAYILERNATWTHTMYNDVDWPGHKAAVKALEPFKVTLVKHLHGNLPVGSRVHRRDPRYSHSCPSCGAPQETDEHLYTCQSESRETWRR